MRIHSPGLFGIKFHKNNKEHVNIPSFTFYLALYVEAFKAGLCGSGSKKEKFEGKNSKKQGQCKKIVVLLQNIN